MVSSCARAGGGCFCCVSRAQAPGVWCTLSFVVCGGNSIPSVMVALNHGTLTAPSPHSQHRQSPAQHSRPSVYSSELLHPSLRYIKLLVEIKNTGLWLYPRSPHLFLCITLSARWPVEFQHAHAVHFVRRTLEPPAACIAVRPTPLSPKRLIGPVPGSCAGLVQALLPNVLFGCVASQWQVFGSLSSQQAFMGQEAVPSRRRCVVPKVILTCTAPRIEVSCSSRKLKN